MLPSTDCPTSIGRASDMSRRVLSNVKLLEFGVVGTTHMTPIISIRVAAMAASSRISKARTRLNHESEAMLGSATYFFKDFSIFAHVSRSVTVRLNTRAFGFESKSIQKYPCRSNWKRSSGFAFLRLGSTWHDVSTCRESGLIGESLSGRS